MPVTVRTVGRYLERRDDARSLAECDFIFSYVDRHMPRALLNLLSGRVVGAAGRVAIVGPGRPCLACWGHIAPDALRLDALRIEALSAEERAALAEEGYVAGAEIAQPSVMPFNTMVAGAAVIELLRLVTAFAGADEPP